MWNGYATAWSISWLVILVVHLRYQVCSSLGYTLVCYICRWSTFWIRCALGCICYFKIGSSWLATSVVQSCATICSLLSSCPGLLVSRYEQYKNGQDSLFSLQVLHASILMLLFHPRQFFANINGFLSRPVLVAKPLMILPILRASASPCWL
jgi:hypothetical protein